MAKDAKNPSKMSFEEAMAELETIVKQLESGNIKLEDAVETYERGVVLKKSCQEKLANAKLRVEKITLDSSNQPQGTAAFEEK